MGQQHDGTQGDACRAKHLNWGRFAAISSRSCHFAKYPLALPEAEPQGNAMISVRITAAGAVAVVSLAFLTAPVSACDERFIKKCERASAAAAAAAEAQDSAPVAKRKSVKRVQVIASRRSKHTRFIKRTRAPGFAVKREIGMTLASASSRATALPETALARRFRGFIDPRPIAQNTFEVWRKPHLVAVNLELPDTMPTPDAAAPAIAETPAQPAAGIVTTAKQDRITPKPAVMELSSAESRPVILPELPRHAAPIAAIMVPMSATQAVLTESPITPAEPQPSGFGFHQLVLALCGALGAASALRFIVGV